MLNKAINLSSYTSCWLGFVDEKGSHCFLVGLDSLFNTIGSSTRVPYSRDAHIIQQTLLENTGCPEGSEINDQKACHCTPVSDDDVFPYSYVLLLDYGNTLQ